MKIVVAIDSFKNSASSLELGEAAKAGILVCLPDTEVKVFEIADGGEGTISALRQTLQGEMISVETLDLLRRPITAHYLLADDTAVIESAQVAGIDKIIPDSVTVQKATSFGLAAVIRDAAERGAAEIILTLGGSGTSDGGLGLLAGLGVELENLSGTFPKLPRLIGLADVVNPYAGSTGYAYFFGAQKGATAEIMAAQDKQAQQVVEQVKQQLGLDLQAIPGSGAAGGLGAAVAILGGKIELGFPKIAELLKIEDEIADADLVLTGEGRMDAQTASGKVPYGMALLAAKHKVPVIALCGSLADDLSQLDEILTAAYSIQTGPISLEEAMDKTTTLDNMRRLSKNIVKTWFH
ncbi:glycerate kinase [Lactovum odontotermitis]